MFKEQVSDPFLARSASGDKTHRGVYKKDQFLTHWKTTQRDLQVRILQICPKPPYPPVDGGCIAVSHHRNHRERRFRQLDTRCKGQGAAMGGVECIEVHIHGHATRTADAGGQNNLVLFDPQFINGTDQGAHDDPVTAPGAPDVRKLFVMT